MAEQNKKLDKILAAVIDRDGREKTMPKAQVFGKTAWERAHLDKTIINGRTVPVIRAYVNQSDKNLDEGFEVVLTAARDGSAPHPPPGGGGGGGRSRSPRAGRLDTRLHPAPVVAKKGFFSSSGSSSGLTAKKPGPSVRPSPAALELRPSASEPRPPSGSTPRAQGGSTPRGNPLL